MRSRVAGIVASAVDDAQLKLYQAPNYGRAEAGWHRDEPIHHMLRINIPITTAGNFLFEIQGEAPYTLDVGYLYWDTNIPHRVYTTSRTDDVRWNAVIGVNPWMDLSEDGKWVRNSFYGMDPMLMLKEGHILDPDWIVVE